MEKSLFQAFSNEKIYINPQLELAGPLRRIAAAFLDSVIFVTWLILSIVVMFMINSYIPHQEASNLPTLITILVISIFLISYLSLYLWMLSRKGKSPAKMIFGLKIVHPGGARPNEERLVMTRFFKTNLYSFPVFFLILDLLFLLNDENHRSLHDRLADTVVIRDR